MVSLRSLALPLLAAGVLTAGAADAPPPLNIVLITADDLRPWLGSYGASWAQHRYVTASLGKVFHESPDDPASWSVPARQPTDPTPAERDAQVPGGDRGKLPSKS